MTKETNNLIEREPVVIIRAAICGHHHSDDCDGCTGSREWNNNMLGQERARAARLSTECDALREALDSICRRYSNGADAETLRQIARAALQQTNKEGQP